MGTAQIKNTLHELKLGGMLECIDALIHEANKEDWSYTDLLDQLLQNENDWRHQRKTQSLIKSSKLMQKPRLEDFDFTIKRNITKTKIKELYQLKWLEQGRPIIITGPTGVGKSFLAQSLGHHACKMRKSTLFITTSNFIENLLLARAANEYLKFKRRMVRPDILIIDDFGLKKLTVEEAHDFCDLLQERTGSKSLVLTTQLPIDHWSEVIEDPVIADAIIDRLKHAAIIMDMKGDTYRKIEAARLDSTGK